MKKITLTFLAIVFSMQTFSQAIWQWATDKLGFKIWASVVDATGNSYITGEFWATTIIGNDTLISSGSADIFIAKINSSGSPLWATRAGGTNGSNGEAGFSISLDNFGNIFIMGVFQTPLAIFGSDSLVSPFNDYFISKLDTSGNFIWARKLGRLAIISANNYVPAACGVSADASGDVYVTGGFYGTGTFGSIILTATSGGSDFFVAKYNSTGSCLWAKHAGGYLYDFGSAITTDAAGNCYVAGRFDQDTVVFDTIVVPLGPGTERTIIIKYNSSGTAQMITTGGYVVGGGIRTQGIDIDNLNNIYITGLFVGTAYFGTASITSLVPNYSNAFIAKFNSSGTPLWAQRGGGSNFNGDYGLGIAVDALGNSYITGIVNSSNATFSSIPVSSTGIFVIAYNSFGNLLWMRQTTGSANRSSCGNGIDIDMSNAIYVSGVCYGDTINFGLDSLFNADGGLVAKIDNLTSVYETVENNFINLFPNPATTEIIVESAEFNVERIEMYSVVGERCLTPALSKGEGVRIDVSSLPAGIYFVALTDENGNRAVRKVVKM